MSNKRKDSSLDRSSSLKKPRLRSPIPQSANDTTGAAGSSSAPPIMTTPFRAADGGMAVTGNQAGHPDVTQLLQQPFPVLTDHLKSGPCILTAPLSNLPVADLAGHSTNPEVGVMNNFERVQNVNTGHNQGVIIQQVNNEVVDLGIQITLKTIEDEQLVSKICAWLSPPDSSSNYHAAHTILKSQPDSCSWFLEGKSFSVWLAEAGFLWIKGKSGCGKTILSSSIIDHLSKTQSSLATAYFFFDGRDSQKELQLHDKLIRSLIWQFSLKCGNGVPKVLADLFSHCGNGYQQPSLDDLHNVLQRILGGFNSAYIILDALDECSERYKVLDWVQTVILDKNENLRLHLITTSRPEKEINDKFEFYPCIDLVEASGDHNIVAYLDYQLQNDSDWHKWGQEIQYEVKSTLINQADGMFRWVALQLMDLKKCRTRKAIREQLNNLPEGLDETYDRILLGIDKRDCGYTKTFLLWLCFAVRPMTLKELAATVTVDLAAENGPQFECENELQDISDVLKMCSSFVESGYTIKLAHFSIKEYLLSKYVEEHHNKKIKAFSLSQELSHSMISQTCLAYLLQFKTTKGKNYADFPLMNYAAKNWIFHVQSSNDDESQESSLLELMIKLLSGYYGNALLAATFFGYETLAKLLLENGADVNAHGGEYGNALQTALYKGHVAIARLLIGRGADVNAQRGYFDIALQAASYRGQEAIAKLLMENGADVNAQGGYCENILQATSSLGHEAITKLLIEYGADVNAQGGLYGNALQTASYKGQEAIAKLLIEGGADVNAQGGCCGNALEASLWNGQEAIAKLLINNGADVNTQGGYFGNALQAASYRGQEAMAKLLIENGADVNAQGGPYKNALEASLYKGQEAIAKLLIENGADLNAQGGYYGAVLQAASYQGQEAIVNLLIENGADVNLKKQPKMSLEL